MRLRTCRLIQVCIQCSVIAQAIKVDIVVGMKLTIAFTRNDDGLFDPSVKKTKCSWVNSIDGNAGCLKIAVSNSVKTVLSSLNLKICPIEIYPFITRLPMGLEEKNRKKCKKRDNLLHANRKGNLTP